MKIHGEKYVKKPVVIEAVELRMPNLPEDLAQWCGGKVCGVGAVGEKVWIEIPTLEGTMRASYGDLDADLLLSDRGTILEITDHLQKTIDAQEAEIERLKKRINDIDPERKS